MSADVEHRVRDALSFLGDGLHEHHDLAPLCTYRVGGAARWFARIDDARQLARVARSLAALGTERPEVLVLGRGSNLLVAGAGFAGLVIALGDGFEQIEQLGAADDEALARSGGAPAAAQVVRVRVGAAASLPVVARRTVAAGLSGFEWAVGVPGSIGGAVRMNAGGHGAEMADSLVGVRVVDLGTGEDVVVQAESLELGYRRSNLREDQVVVSAVLELHEGDPDASAAELADIVRWRREHQPGGQNAGSVFTNPPGDSAGRLIEAAGCKGLRVSSAVVSDKHANFIQVDPGGSPDDVAALMLEVIERVHAHSGVHLHPETVLVGFDEELRGRLVGPRSQGSA